MQVDGKFIIYWMMEAKLLNNFCSVKHIYVNLRHHMSKITLAVT